jgi:hypothetical protein
MIGGFGIECLKDRKFQHVEVIVISLVLLKYSINMKDETAFCGDIKRS